MYATCLQTRTHIHQFSFYIRFVPCINKAPITDLALHFTSSSFDVMHHIAKAYQKNVFCFQLPDHP